MSRNTRSTRLQAFLYPPAYVDIARCIQLSRLAFSFSRGLLTLYNSAPPPILREAVQFLLDLSGSFQGPLLTSLSVHLYGNLVPDIKRPEIAPTAK